MSLRKRFFAALRRLLSPSEAPARFVAEGLEAGGRWPPVYDFDELAATIRGILERGNLEKHLYDSGSNHPSFFQGDLIRLDSDLPFVGPDGQPQVVDGPDFWAVIGNTCDLDKPVAEVPFSQLIPVWDLGRERDVAASSLDAFKKYRYYTQFYFPPWDRATRNRVLVADFTRTVSVHKGALSRGVVVARLTRVGWILFHACVVRFLARDDGRHD